MGKYNFESRKIEEILKRLDELEKANNDLRKENARLKAVSPVKREVTRAIKNHDKAHELFAISEHNGKIIHDEKGFRGNFGTFYQNVFRAINPKVRKSGSRSGLMYTPVEELTDEEYEIYIQALEEVIDLVYYAKKKLEKEEIEND